MLARDTTTDVFDEIREQIRANRPWSFWRPPHGMGGLVDRLTTMEFPRPAVKSLPPSMNYRTRVVRALEAIESGRVDKVVVARQEVLPPADPVATLDALARNFPDCWVFAVSDGRDTFLGATPELLARFEERRLETCALAGSAAPGDDSLLRSPKDLREHQFVVDAIRDALEDLCEEVVIAPGPQLLVLRNVQHLRTTITATLRPQVSALDAVRALHPTPAVCGVPSGAAAELIAELEPFERGLYAGVVGFDDEFVVAIRSARLTSLATHVYAGAGIVAGSDPEAEDEETRAKLRAITEALRFR